MSYDAIFLLLWLSPALGAALWARRRSGRAFDGPGRHPIGSEMTGRDAAELVLAATGATAGLATVAGPLADLYDPDHDLVRLSAASAGGRSIAALAIAAIASGHAAMGARRVLRRILNPLAFATGLGAAASWIALAAAVVIGSNKIAGLGLLLYWAAVLAALARVPIALDAGHRAGRVLAALGVLDEDEERAIRAAVGSAAWGPVAATLPLPTRRRSPTSR
jgi:uncharacterized protein